MGEGDVVGIVLLDGDDVVGDAVSSDCFGDDGPDDCLGDGGPNDCLDDGDAGTMTGLDTDAGGEPTAPRNCRCRSPVARGGGDPVATAANRA